MKKLILLVITMTVFNYINAQSNGGFGLKVGVNRSNIYDSKNDGDGTPSTPRYKNAWAQATLGFRL